MPKGILINDTSGTSNPGCQGTVAGLMNCLAESGCHVAGRLPVGYGYSFFRGEAPPHRQGRLQRARRKFRNFIATDKATLFPAPESTWQQSCDRLLNHVAPLWAGTDVLVINGEGTIHHDSVGARTLLGMAAVAKRLGMRVSLLNCSVFALSDWLLDVLRSSIDELAVREPISFRYLQVEGIPARLTADCLFLATKEKAGMPMTTVGAECARPYAVYSPGVLSGANRVKPETVAADVRQLSSDGLKVYYYVVEAEDEDLAKAAADAGAGIIPLGGLDWRQVIPFLQGAGILISGRYHLNIFAALAGTPFIPLETNTPKMLGLLEHLQDTTTAVRSWDEFSGSAQSKRFDPAAAVRPSASILQACETLALGNRPLAIGPQSS